MLLQFISLCAYRPIWYQLHRPLAINPSWIKDALQSSLSSLFLYFLPPRNSRGICARMMHLWLCIMFVCNLLYLQFKLMHILMCILQHPSWEINPRSTRKQSSLMCRWYSALQWGYIHADAECSDMKRCTVQCCAELESAFSCMPSLAASHMSTMDQLCIWGFFIGALRGSFRPCIAYASMMIHLLSTSTVRPV